MSERDVISRILLQEIENAASANSSVFWYEPGTLAEEWFVKNGVPKPGQVVPFRSGVDFGYLPINVDAIKQLQVSLWTCSYCGGKRPSETFRCEGCGASR